MPTPPPPGEPHTRPIWADAPDGPPCEGWLCAALATTQRDGVWLCQDCAEDLDRRSTELP